MKKLITFLSLIFILTSCSERMTKQFIVPTENNKPFFKTVENWIIDAPKLIAFKNKKIDKPIEDSLTYWLTIRTFNQDGTHNKLQIDSVGLEFTDINSTIWRTPSRVVPMKKENKTHIAFDFFRDQGIEIPDSLNNINLFFNANLIDTVKNTTTTHKVVFNMIRQQTSEFTPFMLE